MHSNSNIKEANNLKKGAKKVQRQKKYFLAQIPPGYSVHWSRWLHLEIVVKFSSQEHTCPPRIQEKNFDFSSRYPIFGYDYRVSQKKYSLSPFLSLSWTGTLTIGGT